MKKFPLLLISLFLLLATLPLRAQKEVGITVQKGVPMISVALPKPIFTSSNPEVVKMGNYIFAVLKEDLAFSLVFSEVPDGFYSFIRPLDPNQIFYKDWESIGAKVLVTTQVKEGTAGEIVYEMGVYDVKTEKMIFGKKYSGRSSIARTISHKAADAMMTAFGEKPIFTSKISFISNRDGNKEVYMMDYDGYNQVRLTDNTYIEMIPAISPDKNRISYTSYRSGRPDLYIQDLTTGRTKLLARGGTNYGAKWSHDGSELTYTSSRSGNAEIYTADGSGGLLSQPPGDRLHLRQRGFAPALRHEQGWKQHPEDLLRGSLQRLSRLEPRRGEPDVRLPDREPVQHLPLQPQGPNRPQVDGGGEEREPLLEPRRPPYRFFLNHPRHRSTLHHGLQRQAPQETDSIGNKHDPLLVEVGRGSENLLLRHYPKRREERSGASRQPRPGGR